MEFLLKSSKYNQLIEHKHINEIFFILLITLCFIGDLLGDFSGHFAVFFWLFMLPVFFMITYLNEKAKEFKTGNRIEHFVRFNILYWCSALISILLILVLWHSEALDAKGSALAIHIVVAHTMFLLGILAGLRFYLIGLFLFVTAGLTIWMESLGGMTVLLSILIYFVGYYFEKHKFLPSISNHIHKH